MAGPEEQRTFFSLKKLNIAGKQVFVLFLTHLDCKKSSLLLALPFTGLFWKIVLGNDFLQVRASWQCNLVAR